MPGSGGTEPLIPAEPEWSMWVWVQPGLLSEIQNSQGYPEKSCLKSKQEQKENRHVRVLSCRLCRFPTTAALGDNTKRLLSLYANWWLW